MKQSKRLEPICYFNKKKEDEAAKELAKVAQEISAQKQRLFDLENYRVEYGKQINHVGGEGLSATQWRDFQRFLANLSNVIEQQKSAISTLEQDFEQKKRQWLAARSRTKALETVKNRYNQQELMADEKQLQKEIDDRGVKPVNH